MATYKQVGYGSQGSDVKNLQQILNKNGYSLAVDGIFGSNTQAAVKDYQKKNNLAADGIVGTNTWGALTSPNATNKNTATTNTGFQYDAYKESDAVKQAQELLNQQLANKPNVTAPNDSFTYDAYQESDAVKQAQELLNQQLANKPIVTAPNNNFTYNAYQESDAVKQAQELLNQQLAQKPGAYQSQWQTQLNEMMDKILNREKFSYDVNGDALYQQYKNQYMMQGQQAMMDTMGQAAAMTGGYGNSYAQTAGQQAYQGYLQQLNDKIPELYQIALNKYQTEGDALMNQYGMMADREQQDYGRYRDTVSDWNSETDRLQSQYNTERDYDYSKWADDRAFSYNQFVDDRNYQYQVGRDQIADWQSELDRLQSQYNAERDYDYSKWADNRDFGYGQYVDDRNYQYQVGRDQITDWQAELDRLQNQYNAERDYDYGKWADNRDFGYGQYVDDRNYEYQLGRDKVTDAQWQAEFNEAVRQFNIANGVGTSAVASTGGGGGGGGYGGSGGGSGGSDGSGGGSGGGTNLNAAINALVRGSDNAGNVYTTNTANRHTASGQQQIKSAVNDAIDAAVKDGTITAKEAAEKKASMRGLVM